MPIVVIYIGVCNDKVMSICVGIKVLQIILFYPVVGVDECNPFAFGVVEAQIAGGAYSAVGFVEGLDARVGGGIAVADVAGTVVAAIVDEQQLPVGIGLRHDALYAPLEPLLGIIYRYYDADFRHYA